jgi:hypothetical protein
VKDKKEKMKGWGIRKRSTGNDVKVGRKRERLRERKEERKKKREKERKKEIGERKNQEVCDTARGKRMKDPIVRREKWD